MVIGCRAIGLQFGTKRTFSDGFPAVHPIEDVLVTVKFLKFKKEYSPLNCLSVGNSRQIAISSRKFSAKKILSPRADEASFDSTSITTAMDLKAHKW
jgi:hypothetical protein